MLRTRDRMSELFAQSEAGAGQPRIVEVADRVERQASLLLTALRSIYIALAAFASATLVTLLGAGMATVHEAFWLRFMASLGLLLGLAGVGGLVVGCANLFRATQLSLVNIREEAALIRRRRDGTG
jgi:hypothetical protein